MDKIAALSFWQPYAWLIVHGHADVDSRKWAPVEKRLGTRMAVHASKKKLTRAGYAEFLEMVRDLKIKDYPKSVEEFQYGALIGTVQLVSVTKKSKSYWAAPGYFHWVLADARKIEPIPMKGQRGWFQVSV